MAEIPRRHEAASPKAAKLVLCVRLVVLESTLGVRFKIQRKTLTHQQLVQAGSFAGGGANAGVPFGVGLVWPQVLAVDAALANQLRQLVTRFHAARPWLGMFVDAHLVKLRRIDAIEFVGHAAKLEGVSVLDDRVLGPARIHWEECQDNHYNHYKKAHRANPEATEMIFSHNVSHNRDTRTGWKGRIQKTRTVFDNLRRRRPPIRQRV